jgi:hypothetical protein
MRSEKSLSILSLRGTKQSVGLMKWCLNTSSRKLTDCFVPRNDRMDARNDRMDTRNGQSRNDMMETRNDKFDIFLKNKQNKIPIFTTD